MKYHEMHLIVPCVQHIAWVAVLLVNIAFSKRTEAVGAVLSSMCMMYRCHVTESNMSHTVSLSARVCTLGLWWSCM
jgi:hypothetical protein